MANLFGMVGSGDFSANRTLGNWREGIFMIEPNGDAMITAITSAAKRAKPMVGTLHTWFERLRETDQATVVAMYTDQALSAAYTPGAGTSGQVLYAKVTLADTENFRMYDRVILGVSNDISQDVNGDVVAVHENGASSYIAVRLNAADDSSTGAFTNINIIAPSFSQGSGGPEALSTVPREFQTRPQIIKDRVEMTRTAITINKRRGIRSGDAWTQAHDDALVRWGGRLDRSAIWEKATVGTGANKQPRYTMMGIREFLTTYGPTSTNAGESRNVFNAVVDTDYSGKEWIEYGGNWLTKIIRIMKRYSQSWGDLLVLGGDEFFSDVEQLALTSGQFTLEEAQAGYGINVRKWITNNGTAYLHNYAAFNHNPRYRRCALWMFPKAVEYLYIDDVNLERDVQEKGTDGSADQWVGECCFQFASPYLFGISYNSGLASTV